MIAIVNRETMSGNIGLTIFFVPILKAPLYFQLDDR